MDGHMVIVLLIWGLPFTDYLHCSWCCMGIWCRYYWWSRLEIWIKTIYWQSIILHSYKTDYNAQFRIATEIQAFQTISKFPIPWISSKNYEMPSSAKRYSDESCIRIKNRQHIGVILKRIWSTIYLKLTSRRFFDK